MKCASRWFLCTDIFFQFIKLITSTYFEHLFAHDQEVLCIPVVVYTVGCLLMMSKFFSNYIETIDRNTLNVTSASCLSYYTDNLAHLMLIVDRLSCYCLHL
jgi:hypothetical protein